MPIRGNKKSYEKKKMLKKINKKKK